MKLKVLKPHYYEGKYKDKGEVYRADIKNGQKHIRLGLCQEIKTEKRERKPRTSKKERK